jgi:hypothetical protein
MVMGTNREDQTDKPGLEEIMRTVRERVEEKRRRGVYDRYDLKAIEALEAEAGASGPERYLRDIWQSADIDLSDFEIRNKGGMLGIPAVWLKKIIWKLLKFYTFRLFSRQKDFNARVAFILQEMDRKFDERLRALEGNNSKR